MLDNGLPVLKHKDEIIETVKGNRVTVIAGETGSGKTTQIPQYLTPYFKRIMVSQPRRISAITLAERVAHEMGVQIGQQVGYNVRFEEKRSSRTKITFVTDGMAIREFMLGTQYDLIIIDEAHERSINTDVLMALMRRMNSSHLKLVVMSATIDTSKFMSFFNSDAVVNISGRTFPTEVYNLIEPVENYMEAAYNAILQIHCSESKGDVLVFLTGEDEILSLFKRLEKIAKEHQFAHKYRLLMLYSALPHEHQHAIFDGAIPERRIILSTNIAETSITIPGVRYVVDCGLMKIRVHDCSKMLDMLTIVAVSKANALQRAGRAGREAPGKCYRLYIKNSYDELEEQITPQILRSELSGPLLQIKIIGVLCLKGLQFMDQPSQASLDRCIELLRELKCMNDKEEVTDYGREVAQIPLPPVWSHLLMTSLSYNCSGIMLSVLSMFSVDNIFYNRGTQGKRFNLHEVLSKYLPTSEGPAINANSNKILVSDHLAKANILREYILSKNQKVFCVNNLINRNNIQRAVLIRQQLQEYLSFIIARRKFLTFTDLTQPAQHDPNMLDILRTVIDAEGVSRWLKCMDKGCIYNTAKLGKDSKYTIVRTGQIAHIHPESLCFYSNPKPSQIVFSQIVRTNRIYLKDITPIG